MKTIATCIQVKYNILVAVCPNFIKYSVLDGGECADIEFRYNTNTVSKFYLL